MELLRMLFIGCAIATFGTELPCLVAANFVASLKNKIAAFTAAYIG